MIPTATVRTLSCRTVRRMPAADDPSSHAQPELRRPLRDAVHQQTIESDARQQQRKAADVAAEHCQQPLTRQRVARTRLKGGGLKQGEARVDGGHGRANRLEHFGRGPCVPDFVGGRGSDALPLKHREIRDVPRRILDVGVAVVSGDADDFPRAVAAGDRLPDRVSREPVRERFADDRDSRCIHSVAFVEVPPGQERDAHGREVSRRGRVEGDAQRLILGEFGSPDLLERGDEVRGRADRSDS